MRVRFSPGTSVQQRKQWLTEALELDDPAQLSNMLGPHWWFYFGRALCEVILPQDSYKVGSQGNLHWDTVGLNAYARDCAAWPGAPGDDLMNQSQFTLFRDIGGHLFGTHSREALRFAMSRMALAEPATATPLNPQLILNLESAIEQTRKNSSL